MNDRERQELILPCGCLSECNPRGDGWTNF